MSSSWLFSFRSRVWELSFSTCYYFCSIFMHSFFILLCMMWRSSRYKSLRFIFIDHSLRTHQKNKNWWVTLLFVCLHVKAFLCVSASERWFDLELRWHYSNESPTRNSLLKKAISSHEFVTWPKQQSMEPWLKRSFTYPNNIRFAKQSRFSLAKMGIPMEVRIFIFFKNFDLDS